MEFDKNTDDETASDSESANQSGGFTSFVESHKIWIIGGIASVITIFFVVIPALTGQSSNANNTSNSTGTSSGTTSSGISTQLDNINQSIAGLANQIGNGTTT